MTQAAAPGASGAPAGGAAPGTEQQPGGAPAQPAGKPAAPAADQLTLDSPYASTSIVEYADTGDAALNLTLEFLGKLGIGPEDAAMKASMNGDFGPLEAMLRTMGDKAKGWEKFLAAGKKSFSDAKSAADAKAAKDLKAIHDLVGGEKNWSSIQDWAKQNAEPHEKEQVNAAFKAGGIAAKAMAFYMQTLYNRAAGTVVEGQPAVGQNAQSGAGAAAPMTAKEYSSQVSALRAKMGHRMEGSAEYAALNARRDAARRAGI